MVTIEYVDLTVPTQYMLFDQMMLCESLSDIPLGIKVHRDIIYGLGSLLLSISGANENRDCYICEGVGQAMIK